MSPTFPALLRRLPRPAAHRQREQHGVHPHRDDWTRRFKKIADDAFLINASSAIIDGEVVVPSAASTTAFSVLQNELKGKSTRIVMIAFDLLYLNGYDLRKPPLVMRKSHLKKVIAKTAIQFSEVSRSTGPGCTSRPARSASRASSPKSATAAIRPAVAMPELRKPAHSA